jgi:8-oxo-dGTP diphosphatase
MPRGPRRQAQPLLTVALVILTIRHSALCVLLSQRAEPPFKGRWALPGGFIFEDEAFQDAALRELKEEASLMAQPLHLEQLRTYGDPGRDPRGRVVTVAYLAIAPDLPEPAVDSAVPAAWRPVDEVLNNRVKLAFDHHQIVDDAVESARSKLEYTSLATALCAAPFTIADLRKVYETVWSTKLDPGNFSRKVTKTDGFIVPTGSYRQGETGRPPALYQGGQVVSLYPPILRSGVDSG